MKPRFHVRAVRGDAKQGLAVLGRVSWRGDDFAEAARAVRRLGRAAVIVDLEEDIIEWPDGRYTQLDGSEIPDDDDIE